MRRQGVGNVIFELARMVQARNLGVRPSFPILRNERKQVSPPPPSDFGPVDTKNVPESPSVNNNKEATKWYKKGKTTR